MNGDQQLPTTPQHEPPKPADNPASLTEPSQPLAPPKPTVVTPSSAVQPPAQVDQAQPMPAEAGLYHPLQSSPVGHGPADAAGIQPAAPADDMVVAWTSSGEALQGQAASARLRMIIISIVAAGLILLTTRDIPVAAVVLVAGMVFGVFGSRKLHSLSYRLDDTGITVGARHYVYAEFKAFSISDYPSLNANLFPFKKFMPPVSLHFEPEMYDQIQAALGRHLPVEPHRSDAIEKFISKVRL